MLYYFDKNIGLHVQSLPPPADDEVISDERTLEEFVETLTSMTLNDFSKSFVGAEPPLVPEAISNSGLLRSNPWPRKDDWYKTISERCVCPLKAKSHFAFISNCSVCPGFKTVLLFSSSAKERTGKIL